MHPPAPLSVAMQNQDGFTYLAVLILAALMGVTLAATAVVWHTTESREKEKELLFVGGEYRRALARYYLNTPSGATRHPRELSELLKDPRYETTQRYLRKLYRDPITGKPGWGVVRNANGGIAGIYSRSDEAPFKRSNFSIENSDFEQKTRYSDWKFVYSAPRSIAAPPTPEK